MAEFFLLVTNSHFGSFVLVASVFIATWFALGGASRPPAPMGRFAYGLVSIAAAMTIALCGQVFWVVAPSGADRAAATALGGMVIAGAVLAWGARGRAADAFGPTDAAFLALVPLLGLVLNFKASAQRGVCRSGLARLGRAAGFVAIALTGFSAWSMASAGIHARMSAGALVKTSDLAIERALRIQALIDRGSISSGTERNLNLVEARADGAGLTYRYVLAGDLTRLDAEHASTFLEPGGAQSACSSRALRRLLKRGASVTMEFHWDSPDHGEQAVPVSVREQTCAEL
jgi:hypothetical protein